MRCARAAGDRTASGLLDDLTRSTPVVLRLSAFEPESVQWLWRGRLARGKLTLIVGDPGLGKSFMTLDLASRLTRGGTWPDGEPIEAPGRVLLLSAEDAPGDTIRPRVDAAGGIAGRICMLAAVKRPLDEREAPFNLVDDLPALDAAVLSAGADLVVIDPLSAYFGGAGMVDTHRDSDVRAVLMPLAELADRARVSVVGVMHLTKSADRRAISRVLGSIGFVGQARIVLAVAKDPEDEGRRLVVPLKNNLSEPPATLAFTVAGGRLVWEPTAVDGVDADQVLGPPPRNQRDGARDAAVSFLREALRDGERRADDVLREARREGITFTTLRRASEGLKVRKRRDGRAGVWFWALPQAEQDAHRGGQGAHMWRGEHLALQPPDDAVHRRPRQPVPPIIPSSNGRQPVPSEPGA